MLFLLKCCFVHLQLNQSRGEMHADIESDRDQRRKIFFFFKNTADRFDLAGKGTF
jgi:hypothetical protein